MVTTYAIVEPGTELGDVIGPVAGDRRAVRFEHQFQEGELESEGRAAGLTVVFHRRDDVGTAALMAALVAKLMWASR